MRRGSKTSLPPLNSSHGLSFLRLRCRFSILIPHIPRPDEKTMRSTISNVFPIKCQSASHNGALSLRGDTSSCEPEPEHCYPAVSGISPRGVQRCQHMVHEEQKSNLKMMMHCLVVGCNFQGNRSYFFIPS